MRNKSIDRMYKIHLTEQLENKRLLAAREVGKSDLENSNYLKNMDEWYAQVYIAIDEHPPVYYVRELTIYQSANRIVNEIVYNYYYTDDIIDDVTLCVIEE